MSPEPAARTDGRESVAAFDARTGATYAYAPAARFRTASTVKAAMMGTLLLQTQEAGRALSARERDCATRMIEFSDNDATNTLWDAIGRGAGLARFTAKVGMHATEAAGIATTEAAARLAVGGLGRT